MENNSDEIDIINLLKTIWDRRKEIIIISFVFALIGVVSSFIAPIVYTSTTTFINSQTESTTSSNLSGVASLVGVSIGGIASNNEIPPRMYPQIGESVEFKRKLLEKTIDVKKEIKLIDFLKKYHGIKHSSAESSLNKNIKAYVSETENELFEVIDEVVIIAINRKDMFVTISANMPNSEYAASTCINAREILQEIVVNNRIKGAKQKLEYSEEQLASKRIEFEEVQNKLADFNDSNLNIVTSAIINQRAKLEAEFNIINAVMVELSKQVEQRKLQVSEDTPVFSVIKEASMPVKKSSPKITQMVLIFGLIGFVISSVYVLIKNLYLGPSKLLALKKKI